MSKQALPGGVRCVYKVRSLGALQITNLRTMVRAPAIVEEGAGAVALKLEGMNKLICTVGRR